MNLKFDQTEKYLYISFKIVPKIRKSTMFLKYVFWFSICISLFFSVQLSAQEKENVTIKDSNDLDSVTDSLQNPADLAWEPCISPFIELLGKGLLSMNVDFRKKESYAISIGFQPFEGLAPNIMYYQFSGKL
jgi:hypothetical protein